MWTKVHFLEGTGDLYIAPVRPRRPRMARLVSKPYSPGIFIITLVIFCWNRYPVCMFCRNVRMPPLLWVKEREMKPWHQDIFRILGVQNRHIFVTEPARVRSLVVGNCGFSIGNYFRPYHERFLGKVEWQPISGRWIWLSRSKLAADLGGIDNETDIEAVLALNGWTIFHAQEHSLDQQVKILSDAERIAGFEGSAFHLLVLLDQIHARIDIFSRGSSINRNFDLIAQAKRLDQRVHGVAMEQISGARSFSRYRIGDLDEVVAKLAAA